MLAAETRGGPAVVFRYLDQDGRLLYDKFRPIGDRKVFWRVPRGRPSALYGLGDLPKGGGARVIVVEGEIDLHALRAAGVGPVVSVPDGAGSRLSPELLRPLAGFRPILIATDADAPGDDLAARLGRELGPERCRRVRLVDGLNTLKDANDALRAGWTRERFEAALAAATPATRARCSAPTGPPTRGERDRAPRRRRRRIEPVSSPRRPALSDAPRPRRQRDDPGPRELRRAHLRGGRVRRRRRGRARVQGTWTPRERRAALRRAVNGVRVRRPQLGPERLGRSRAGDRRPGR